MSKNIAKSGLKGIIYGQNGSTQFLDLSVRNTQRIFFQKRAKGFAKVVDKNTSQAEMRFARLKYRSGTEAWSNRSRKKAHEYCVWTSDNVDRCMLGNLSDFLD